MRIADLFQEGEGIYQTYEFGIKFKEGVIIDDARIELTKDNIRKSIIDAGGDCFGITLKQKEFLKQFARNSDISMSELFRQAKNNESS